MYVNAYWHFRLPPRSNHYLARFQRLFFTVDLQPVNLVSNLYSLINEPAIARSWHCFALAYTSPLSTSIWILRRLLTCMAYKLLKHVVSTSWLQKTQKLTDKGGHCKCAAWFLFFLWFVFHPVSKICQYSKLLFRLVATLMIRTLLRDRFRSNWGVQVMWCWLSTLSFFNVANTGTMRYWAVGTESLLVLSDHTSDKMRSVEVMK